MGERVLVENGDFVPAARADFATADPRRPAPTISTNICCRDLHSGRLDDGRARPMRPGGPPPRRSPSPPGAVTITRQFALLTTYLVMSPT